jgi:flavodoxin
MNKILIVYVSRTGTTQKMAEYLAEGCRNQKAVVKLKLFLSPKK